MVEAVPDDDVTLPRAAVNKMIKEMIPNVRVSNDARELILNCCTGSTGFKKSSTSFLFTLENMDGTAGVKLDVQDTSKAIYSDPSYGSCFGDGDLVISDMAEKSLNSSSRLGTSYSLPNAIISGSVDAVNLLAGSEYFMPDDLEVFHIECFHPLGMENGDILDSQITQLTGDYKGPNDINNAPWQARLNNPSGNTWIASQPSEATLIVDLKEVYHVIGIEAHGNNKCPAKPGYPTNFEIQYKPSLGSWVVAQSGLSLDDAFSIKRFLFVPSFQAELLKFILSQCVNDECGFAIEIYGCFAELCDKALRMENITASSSSLNYQPIEAQLDSSSCWKPLTDNDPKDYLQVDLGSIKLLQRVDTRALTSQTYVESYKIQYSTDGVKWEYYPNFDGTPKVFTSGSGNSTVLLEFVVQVRFVRFYPVSGDKCVKLELHGCTSMKGGYAEILSSGSDPGEETGMLIYSQSKLKAQYQATEASCYSKTNPLSSTEWTRFTFVLKKNFDTRIFLDNVNVGSHEHPDQDWPLNFEKSINFATHLSFVGWWSVENIQLSDLSLWRDIPRDGSWETWAGVTLPETLDLCNFDDSPCPWKIGNWTVAKDCVPSNSLGTGPCLDKNGGTSFYIHLESSNPRSKGESVRFESPYVISSYKCVTFWYHMWGKHVGRLNMFVAQKVGSEKLKWRLSGDQGDSWNEGSTGINNTFAYKVIFEAVVGDGFLGDIAIDEVTLSTASCNTVPKSAKPGVSSLSGHDLEKSAIVGHLETFKTLLTQALNDAGVEEEIWIPCYRALTDGRDVAEFYSRCGGKGMTVTIVRSDNYIFGGYTDKDWGSSVEKGAGVSYNAFLFSLSSKQGTDPMLFPLKTDKRYTAHPVKPGQGPTFGNGDLVLETMSSGHSELGNSFGTTADASFLFAEANNFVISDVEVLYKGDTLCAELCNHDEGSCDEITGKCECDWLDRSVEWCLEGEPKKVINLYQDAVSYWALDSLEELKDRGTVGWGRAHGGVSLESKGLSGQALQLDGVSGWIDFGDLGTACPEAGCSEDFSMSMWFKYNPKENNQDQSYLTLDSGVLDFKLFYDAALKEVGVALNTPTLSASYMFSVSEGFWTYLGVFWNSVEKFIGIQHNGETLPTTITWNVCHACERLPSSNTSVTLGNGSFPNASFDEIGIWFQALENQNFVDIYNTYKGPERLHVELSLQFTGISWREDFLDPESADYTMLLQDLRAEITTFYSSMPDVATSSDNITMSKCWNDSGLVSCDLQVTYYSSGYKQLQLLLDDWLPSANALGFSEIVLLGSRNDNVPSTAVSGLTANAAGPSSVNVSWEPPPEEDNPGILVNYEVDYKTTGSENWLTEQVWNTEEPYVITGLEAFTSYTVSVTMVNLEGKGIAASANVSTEEGAPPRPPANVTASNTTSNSIALEWDPPEGHIPGVLRGYRIFYARAPDIINTTVYKTVDNENITYRIAKDMTLKNVTIDDVDLTEYTVTGLEPYTWYFLWVTAFTVSDSPNSHAVSWATEEDVPDAAPLIQQVTASSSNECLLSWRPIPAEHHRGVLLGYRIVYTTENDALNSLNITVGVSEYRDIPVDGLRHYTNYLLKVAGFTSKGDGNYSIVEECQTLESVPSLPPEDREVYNVTSTSCEIRWGPIPDEHQNGVIIGYELQYAPYSRDSFEIIMDELQNVSLGANTPSYRLTGLNIYTQYSISIVGETSAGTGVHGGPESRSLCTTKADYPSGRPTGLSVVDSTAVSCWLNWTAIPDEDINGESVSYEVHVVKNESADQGFDGEPSITVLACGNTTEANVTMLDMFTVYSIKVAFHNNIGAGNFSDTVECITEEGAPTLPPQNIRGHNTSSSSIKVYWDPVPEANRHGIIREYHFYIYPIQSPVSSFDDVDTTGDLYKTFTGLQPYWNYSIQMAAKTVELGNYSEPIFVMTGEEAPGTAPDIIQAYNTSGRSIFIQWTPPPGPVSGIIRGYRIFYKNLNLSLSPVEDTSVDANTLSYEITSLEPNSEYRIRILAFTVADGPKSDSKSVYTDKKVLPPPDGIPENVVLSSTTSTSCFLLWDAAGNSIEDPDGAILGYYIYYRKDGSRDSFAKIDVQGENMTSSDVEGLQEYTRCEFYIAAYNYYGEGNASDVFQCFTDEDAPSSAPVNITSVQVTPRRIQIEWYLPKEEDWNGIIRGFTIIYYRKDEGNSSATFVDVPVSSLNVQLPGLSGNRGSLRRKRATDVSWSLTGLEEYTIYIIHVVFYTVGISPYSLPLEIQTAEDVPSSPPTRVLVTNNGSSTSLWITWSDVQDIDQNGVITSFVIGYWLKDDIGSRVNLNVSKASVSSPATRRKRASVASYDYVLEGLRIWTEYYVVVAAVTVGQGPFSEPYLVRTDEGVPCLPPQYVTYDVPGLSMLFAKWQPVPAHCRNGAILGYRVRYQRLDGAYPARIENTTADVLYAFLYDMDIYANYSIEISAFTRKGEGIATLDLALPDTLGPKKTPTNVTSYNYTSTTSINVTWLPFEDLFILERMLGYRVSYRAVRIGDKNVEKGEAPTYNLTVRKTTLTVVIEGLESYTRYQINVSGFSRRGDGPSAITEGDTCRCQKRLASNYRTFPPYVDQFQVSDDGRFTVANMTGMLPKILDDLVVTCCQTCGAHGRSYVDFKYNGTNGTAKQNSEREMKFLIEDRNDLSFPVYGWKWQDYYSADYRYIPLVESPGVAFIIIEKEGRSPSQRLVNEVFATWPYLVITTLLAALAGIVIWFLDTKSNPDHFPRTFLRGSGNGFWWAFISMTTLGYGDKVPKANVSKAFAIVWILTGLVMMSILSGALTTAITIFVFEADIILYGTKVAAIQDTPEYRLAVSRNARVIEGKNYTTFSEVYDALINEEVQGMLIDTYEAGYKKDQFKDPRIRVHTIYDYKSTYGVVLAGNSTKLLQCSKGYMQSHRAEMHEHIAKFIHSIEEEHVPEILEVSSGLFDPQNEVFRYFSYIISACLAVAIILGLMWEYRRKLRIRKVEQGEGHFIREKTRERHEEMKTFVAEFYCNFKANYTRLIKEHRLHLKSFKAQHPNTKLAWANNGPSARRGFFNEAYDQRMKFSSIVDSGGVKSDKVSALLH